MSKVRAAVRGPRGIVPVLAIAATLLGTDTFAQDRQGQAALDRLVASGEEVLIYADPDTSPIRAHLLSVENGLLTLMDAAGRTREVTVASVARVARDGDTVADGILIGAALLGGPCLWTCRLNANSSKHHKQLVLGNVLVGGFFGWLVDRNRRGTTTVYRREPRANVALALSPASVGLEVRLRLP